MELQRLLVIAHVAVDVAEVVEAVRQPFPVAVLLADRERLQVVLQRVHEPAGVRFDQAERVVALCFAPAIAGLGEQANGRLRVAAREIEPALIAVRVGDVVVRLGLTPKVSGGPGRLLCLGGGGQRLVGRGLTELACLRIEIGNRPGGARLSDDWSCGHRRQDADPSHPNANSPTSSCHPAYPRTGYA